MRWTEIVDYAEPAGYTLPTYRQMDIWTRAGLLTAEFRGDRHGRYRWWPPEEVEAALTVARLVADLGMSSDLAFKLARSEPGAGGARTMVLDGGKQPVVRVEVEDEHPTP